jgi:hypothetical protein
MIITTNEGACASLGGLVDALASVSAERLRADVEALAIPRHRIHEERANRRVRDLVSTRLRGLGLEVALQGDLDNVVATTRGVGPRAPRVLVGAHYDSVPGTPGADDDASGLAVMLESARVMTSCFPSSAMMFVAWNGEEDGLLGSKEHAAVLEPGVVACAHVLEMVGFCSHAPGSQRLPDGLPISAPGVGDFIGLVGNSGSNAIVDEVVRLSRAYTPDLPVVGLKVMLGVERLLPVLHRSDHSPLWARGIPAVMWTDTSEYRNANYHRATDTPDTLDYGFMRRVAQLLLASVITARA